MESITKYWVENRELWPDIGMEGCKAILDRYNINQLNDRFVGIYHDLLTC
jgi:hypothetical protein